MTVAIDNFRAALDALVEEAEADVALALITGAFVGLVKAVMESNGLDTSGAILIDGGTNRDITIHAVKPKATNEGIPT